MVRLLEPYDLRWLEKALIPDDIEGYAVLTRESPIPIAHGEHEFTIAGFAEIARRGAGRVLQFDTNRVGGITQAVKVCALAEAFGLDVVPHAGQAHNYHIVASQPACPMAEYFPPEAIEVGNELRHWLFDGEPPAENGRVTLNGKPGLGIQVRPRGSRCARSPIEGEEMTSLPGQATERANVVVVGAGLAWLSAAWHLRDRHMIVLEASQRVRGRLCSEARGDLWLNFGAHVFGRSTSPAGQLIQALGLTRGRHRAVSQPRSCVGCSPRPAASKGCRFSSRSRHSTDSRSCASAHGYGLRCGVTDRSPSFGRASTSTPDRSGSWAS
jgi:hypothetical protein